MEIGAIVKKKPIERTNVIRVINGRFLIRFLRTDSNVFIDFYNENGKNTYK